MALGDSLVFVMLKPRVRRHVLKCPRSEDEAAVWQMCWKKFFSEVVLRLFKLALCQDGLINVLFTVTAFQQPSSCKVSQIHIFLSSV